jgi:general secretion pathway protein G
MIGLSYTHASSRPQGRSARGGFSLIELVIVVVIIGIIAAIAIPRMSRGSQGAADSALAGNLSVLRNAIDLYQTEHQIYPASGLNEDQAVFERQLTKYTDAAGGGTATQPKDSTHVYGPYLRKVPPLPVGSKKGQSTIRVAAVESELPGLTTHAWIYYPTTGEIKANLLDTEVDSKGTVYNQY